MDTNNDDFVETETEVKEVVTTEANNPPASTPQLQTTEDTKKSFRNLSRSTHLKIIAVLAAIFLVLLGITGYLYMTKEDTDDDAANKVTVQPTQKLAASIGLVEGDVQYSSDAETWSDAEGGETIKAGQYLRTLADSRAVLLLDDGSAVRLDGESQIMLAVSQTETVEVMLLEGQVYSRVVESETRTYAVTTARDRYEALGTAYKTSTSDVMDGLEVYQSTVKVDSETLDVEEGNKYDTDTKEKTGIDLEKLETDDFVQWNKEKDAKDESFKDKLGVLKDQPKEEEKKETSAKPPTNTQPVGKISLSGSATNDGVKVSWSTSNVNLGDGFKIVRDKTDSTPTYKENTSIYISNKDTRIYTLKIADGKSYHFRVCIYRASTGTCDTYSNSVQVTAPNNPPETVQAGTVTLAINGKNISWSITGTAPHGYKVVLNSDGNPTYPSNSIQYVGAGTKNATLPDKPSGTYFVRVCKYTGSSSINGGCTDYSNEVEYIVSE